MDSLITSALIGIMALAAGLDVRKRRIPNWVTVSGLAIALAVRAMPGAPAMVPGLLGFGLAFGIVLPLFALGLLAGGDAKLLMVVGALLGPTPFLVAFVYTSIAGGVLALAAGIKTGTLKASLARIMSLIGSFVGSGGPSRASSVTGVSSVTIPYGVAIAIGAVTAHFFPFLG